MFKFRQTLSNKQPENIATRIEQADLNQLEEMLRDSNLDSFVRSLIGERLNQLGDHRSGVGLRSDGLPDLVWLPVPEGKVTVKTLKHEINSECLRLQLGLKEDLIKKDRIELPVEHFYVAKYQITNQQFHTFLEASDGYEDSRWWPGTLPHPKTAQDTPFNNYPRTNVAWLQAVAFTKWLNARLPVDARPEGARGAEWQIRLPTEWEWQQAATGGDSSNVYPWGRSWKANYCNSEEAGLGRPVAVGMYPLGASSAGAMDMSGNIADWSLNSRIVKEAIDPMGENEMSWGGAHVYCGGSFWNYRDACRCVSPAISYTHLFDSKRYIGFRCVLARRPYCENPFWIDDYDLP